MTLWIACNTYYWLAHVLLLITVESVLLLITVESITIESTVENMCLAPTRPPVAATTSFRRGGGAKRTISPLFGFAPTFDDTFSTRRRSDVHSRKLALW
jgi:hypothetical protein